MRAFTNASYIVRQNFFFIDQSGNRFCDRINRLVLTYE